MAARSRSQRIPFYMESCALLARTPAPLTRQSRILRFAQDDNHAPASRHMPRLHRIALIVVGLAIASCNSTNLPSVPEGVSAVSGNDQYTTVGTVIANPLVVRVFDGSGSPFSGATVSWTVTAGGGTVADSTSTSDATGHATMSYTAGPTAGVATVVATVSQAWTTSFTIYVEPSSNAIRLR